MNARLKVQNTNIALAISKLFHWSGAGNSAFKVRTISAIGWYFKLIVKYEVFYLLKEKKSLLMFTHPLWRMVCTVAEMLRKWHSYSMFHIYLLCFILHLLYVYMYIICFFSFAMFLFSYCLIWNICDNVFVFNIYFMFKIVIISNFCYEKIFLF